METRQKGPGCLHLEIKARFFLVLGGGTTHRATTVPYLKGQKLQIQTQRPMLGTFYDSILQRSPMP